MNLKSFTALMFVVIFFSKGCEMLFPRGNAQAEEKNCERAVVGRVESIVSPDEKGEDTITIVDIEGYGNAEKREMRPERENRLPKFLQLKLEPGTLKVQADKSIINKNLTFYFTDRKCGVYNKVHKIIVQYLSGEKDISALLFRQKKSRERR